MGFLSDCKKAKEDAEKEFERKHHFLSMIANKQSNIDKYDLSDEEMDAVKYEGYEPEDFEDDELEEDDYYYDEK